MYLKSGIYNVKLTVTNDKGAKNSLFFEVDVTQKTETVTDGEVITFDSSQKIEPDKYLILTK